MKMGGIFADPAKIPGESGTSTRSETRIPLGSVLTHWFGFFGYPPKDDPNIWVPKYLGPPKTYLGPTARKVGPTARIVGPAAKKS